MELQVPKADENGWVSTLNNMGYMSLSFDPYTKEYLDFCEKHPGITVFEAGAAYGQAVQAALQRGVKVVANDLEEKHLKLLSTNIPQALRANLSLKPGSLPDNVDFPDNSFEAIFSSRMIHFLTGKELESCLLKFFNWLKKGGMLFLIAETPYLKSFSSFIPIYEQRKEKGEEWPGLINDTSAYKSIRYNNIPPFIHFLDPDILRSNCEKVGFLVKKTEMINRVDFPPELRLDGRESVGLVAVKPV